MGAGPFDGLLEPYPRQEAGAGFGQALALRAWPQDSDISRILERSEPLAEGQGRGLLPLQQSAPSPCSRPSPSRANDSPVSHTITAKSRSADPLRSPMQQFGTRLSSTLRMLFVHRFSSQPRMKVPAAAS
ncbi:hypothetical protein DIPPA_12750 [Diplonema papillatum]|nr:hypothetical protein DIPPA_12750 [Diplonema papillatum]